ncbi:MAG: hypothetical protein KF868_20235 [Acidobacteria bacterium]|nr:hypothetical protein [Acidobacteriota bacterium]
MMHRRFSGNRIFHLVLAIAVITGLFLVEGAFAQKRAGSKTTSKSRNTKKAPPRAPAAAPVPSPQKDRNPIKSESRKRSYDNPGEAAEYERAKRAPVGETAVPVERYLIAAEKMRVMRQYSTPEGRALPSRAEMRNRAEQNLLAWTPLGPGNIGGRTRALLIHPTNPDIMYAAGVAGGVWKTVNGGMMWQPLTDMISNIAVSALTFDPTNPEIIYAGTGEGYFNADSQRGLGIFKTTDGGLTWQALASTLNADFFFVNDIVISPGNSERLYAATRSGIHRSTDGGLTWTQTYFSIERGGCMDLAIRTDQTSTDQIVAACGSSPQSVVLRNPDAAAPVQTSPWTPVINEIGMGRVTLAIAPSNQEIIYAAVASAQTGSQFFNGFYAVFRSTNGGANWEARVRNTSATKLNTVLFSNTVNASRSQCGFGADQFFNQGWYDNVIAVDPVNPDMVWVGGIDMFRSDDGGANFGLASHWWAADTNPRYLHADQHRIVFHPQYNGTTNQIMYVGNDGGVFRTDNARGTVAAFATAPCNTNNGGVFWTSLNNNYGVTQFYHGAPYPDGRTYFGGTQDNGTIRGDDDRGSDAWNEIFGGDGGYVAVDPTNPRTIYLETQNLAIRKSINGGATVRSATSGIVNSGFAFIVPFTMDPSDPRRLWTGGDRLWRTINGAINWQQAGAIFSGSVSAVAVAPGDANRVLAGLNNGRIHRHTEALLSGATTTWEFAQPRAGVVSWLTFDPNNPEVAYATYSTFGGSHVWRSTDGGANWTAIDGSDATGIPDIPVHSIAVDPTNTARLYVGTDLGVFVSLDAGASWSVENTGFANVITETLAINIVDGATQLFAFTHGRGAYRTNLNQIGCNYALSPKTVNTTAGAAAGSVNVTVGPAGCAWSAESNVEWIRLAQGGSGNAGGTVGYTVDPNPGFQPRAGTVKIAGLSFTVVQEGQADREAPNLQILSPVTNPFITTQPSTSITGTADDQSQVASIFWSTDRGQTGTATGIANWTIPTLLLLPGANNVTVTAVDAAGNTSTASLLVISQPTVDSTPPVISITAPTSMPVFETSTLPITVSGTATDNLQVTHVTWKNDRGGSGTASGTATWSIFGAAFKVGVNRLTVTAWDGAGNRADATLEINTTPAQALTRIAGNLLQGYTGDGGAAVEARLSLPRAVAVDRNGVVYIADTENHAIRRVGADGTIHTVAGTGTDGFGGDGAPALIATLNGPRALVFDETGNLYFSDTNNHAVRRISPDGIITTIAGTGISGSGGGDGPAAQAQLNAPLGLAFDSKGDLYIVDTGNHCVRKITMSTGMIARVAGIGALGFAGDGGPALQASLSAPAGIAIDKDDNLYIVDQANARVRKVTASTGNISTIIGTGAQTYGGDGGPGTSAQINQARLIAVDAQGVLYIADQSNNRIRRYGTDGIITTIAGNGGTGSGGEGGAPGAAQFVFPTGVAVDSAGAVYIADGGNHRILRISSYGAAAAVSAASFSGAALAPDSIAAAFSGDNRLATGIEIGNGLPLPTSLAGTTLRLRDASGNEQPAGLFFVSPGQVNFYIPPKVAPGAATLLARSGASDVTIGVINISTVAPGIFTANQNGAGVPAAVALRVGANGSQVNEQVAALSGDQFIPVPIDLGPEGEQVFLVLFGTGLRNRSSLADVRVTIGGVDCEVLYAGPQGDFIGLDQINVRLQRALAGRGEVDVVLTVGAAAANTVRVSIR